MMDTDALWQAIAAYGNARWRGYSHEIDAADHLAEIKRLLNEADEEYKSLLAENERLVDEVAELKAAYESQFKELHTLKTENERLVDEVAEARKEISEQARLNGMGEDAGLSPAAQEPTAWLTRNDEGDPQMLFFDPAEARTYCDDDEEPEPLYLHPAPPGANENSMIDLTTSSWRILR